MTRPFTNQDSMMDEPSTAAREAIRIADKHLAGGTIDQRKALAHEIVGAISLCERELGDVLLAVVRGINPPHKEDRVQGTTEPASTAERSSGNGASFAMGERMWCTACGTVTADNICDCNRYGAGHEMYREAHFVNYADAMQEAAHEQAQRVDVLEKALRLARARIEYLGAACPDSRHFTANADTFLPAVDEALATGEASGLPDDRSAVDKQRGGSVNQRTSP